MKSVNDQQNSVCLFHSNFGEMAVIWSIFKNQPKISYVLIPQPDSTVRKRISQFQPDLISRSCTVIDRAASQIQAFLSGEPIFFPLDIIRLDRCPLFQKRVLYAGYEIPRGRVSTYGLIAKHLKKPGAARAVGTALATNPFPIIIPCHRAIRSTGHLGGFQGGPAMKKALLEMEGIEFKDTTHVATKHFYYQILP